MEERTSRGPWRRARPNLVSMRQQWQDCRIILTRGGLPLRGAKQNRVPGSSVGE